MTSVRRCLSSHTVRRGKLLGAAWNELNDIICLLKLITSAVEAFILNEKKNCLLDRVRGRGYILFVAREYEMYRLGLIINVGVLDVPYNWMAGKHLVFNIPCLSFVFISAIIAGCLPVIYISYSKTIKNKL